MQFQTTPFLTYAFVSLRTVACYGNYTIIIDKLTILMNTVLGSTSAGVGNLIAEGNKGKIKTVFWELTTFRFFIAGMIFFALFLLMETFIKLWVGEQYILSPLVLLLATTTVYFQICTGCLGMFLFGFGLFADVWAPVAQSIIYLSVAIIGGHFIGLPGIIFGSLLSIVIIMGIWKPYYLWSRGFKEPVSDYWGMWGRLMLINAVAISVLIFAFRCLNFRIDGVLDWLLYAIMAVGAYLCVNGILMYAFNKYARSLFSRFFSRYK